MDKIHKDIFLKATGFAIGLNPYLLEKGKPDLWKKLRKYC
jgi:hypothetical protein